MEGDGIFYFNVNSLGKSSNNNLSVIAVDCNGISWSTQAIDTWPVVMITAPLDQYVDGDPNPYSYSVPDWSTNSIRALVFDPSPVTQVRYRINGAPTWHTMTEVAGNSRLWEGVWDASDLSAGDHTIEVQAVGSTTRSDIITTYVYDANRPPVAYDDNYTAQQGQVLTVDSPGVLGNDTDADGDVLSAFPMTDPGHGTVMLYPNGAFIYTPEPGYIGEDSFTYVANDGRDDSNIATVFIEVMESPEKPVRITVLPRATVIPRGGVLWVDFRLSNETYEPRDVRAMVDLILPSGEPYMGNPITGPVNLNLPGVSTLEGALSYNIPVAAFLGIYTYIAKVEHPPGTLMDQDSFTFEITP